MKLKRKYGYLRKKNALIKSEKIERGEKIDFFDIEIIQLEKNRLKFKAD